MKTFSIRRVAQTARGVALALAALGALAMPAASTFAAPDSQMRMVDGFSVYHTQYGRQLTGTLSAGDNRVTDGSRADFFEFDGRQGDCALITMHSDNIDSYLELSYGSPANDAFRTNDDGGPGRDSRIRVTLPYTGVYYIMAGSYGSGLDTGRFTVTLDRC